MPVQLERQQRESGLLVKERASFSKSQKCSGPYSGWVEPDSNVAVLNELVTAASARDRATTATPISEACSRRLLRHGERPRSCPGGRVGGTSGVPAGTTSSRRLTNVGSKASEASPGSAQGLGVYCSSLELAVGKKLHGRHGSSSKRASSASSASEQAGSLPAWNPSASKAAGKGSSGSGSQAAGERLRGCEGWLARHPRMPKLYCCRTMSPHPSTMHTCSFKLHVLAEFVILCKLWREVDYMRRPISATDASSVSSHSKPL